MIQRPRHQNGFTLIEVLVVLMILAVLATLSAQTIQRSVQMKTKIQKGIDQQSALRNALAVFERDASRAFHYRDPNYEIEELIQKKKEAAGENPENPMRKLQKPEPVTQFIGESGKVSFTSLANVRIAPDAAESDQMEVSYYKKNCRSFMQPDKNMECLFRKISPVLDKDTEEGGTPTAILENVTSFKLRYFGEGKEDWVDTWKTNESGDDVTKEHFPNAVEITLETEENGKKMKMSSVAQIRFPNNKPKKTAGEPSAEPGTSR